MSMIRPKAFLGACVGVLVAALMPSISEAADHRDSPRLMANITFEGNLDINDVYIFQSPTTKNSTVMIVTLSPDAGVVGPAQFRPFVNYEIRVQNTAALADNLVFVFNFSEPDAYGRQNFQVVKRSAKGQPLVTQAGVAPASAITAQQIAFGTTGQTVAVKGGGKVTAGLFDDPFFFDLNAFNEFVALAKAGASLPARVAPFLPPNIPNNFFGGFNVLALVLEMPTSSLTSPGNSKLGVWVRTIAPGDQIDRMGRPAINTAAIPSDVKNTFNIGSPFFDQQQFTAAMIGDLQLLYGASATYASGLASVLLPDLLTIDTSKPTAFLNGRKLTDDVIDAEFKLLTNGALTSDRVSNDSVFSNSFPYLGSPNPKSPK
jgi:Domain of unknown function (DUF4331)